MRMTNESLREQAEDSDLTSAVQTWWDMNLDRGNSIASILLLRACDALGILPNGVNAQEVINRCKTPTTWTARSSRNGAQLDSDSDTEHPKNKN